MVCVYKEFVFSYKDWTDILRTMLREMLISIEVCVTLNPSTKPPQPRYNQRTDQT
jgi:hypothetical protein